MNSKNIQNNASYNRPLKTTKSLFSCEVSKASVEIMLDRFSNGKEIDFPFSQ